MATPLTLRRELFVPAELVFDAWTRAEHLTQWYPPADADLVVTDTAPGPAGPWTLEWTEPDGARLVERGTCVALGAPRRLRWRLRLDAVDSELEVHMEGHCGTCTLELVHSGVTTAASRERYRAIWEARLERLEAYFSAI